MARDPFLPLTDVQWVLGHAQLSTTQIYLMPMPVDVITGVLGHHRRSEVAAGQPSTAASGYRSESLDVLFAGGGWRNTTDNGTEFVAICGAAVAIRSKRGISPMPGNELTCNFKPVRQVLRFGEAQ
jgi:hypothetical protein